MDITTLMDSENAFFSRAQTECAHQKWSESAKSNLPPTVTAFRKVLSTKQVCFIILDHLLTHEPQMLTKKVQNSLENYHISSRAGAGSSLHMPSEAPPAENDASTKG
ncbi:hypothetical protein KIN20_005714 [Parelaphostrongylus tenuis]|uniref:Uncharacterized protein n=1 Tax=Parelaphostrongylus tenuis TaxID=148309 RepID=A0AAD5M3P0_PARTN|nr:hypothetical protein KIN20_005714 [Parelaphostrongylus tenuis]